MGNKLSRDYFTVPNMLSLLRLALIPLFVWFYKTKNAAYTGCAVLLVSGATDILDGYIARRFNMVSDIGKILDPVADKLTQAVTLICLAGRFPMMLLPLVIMFFKELVGAALCFLAIRRSGEVKSSVWHGKLNTVLLYAMLSLHLVWANIPAPVSAGFIGLCSAMMLFSFVLYAIGNISVLLKRKNLP